MARQCDHMPVIFAHTEAADCCFGNIVIQRAAESSKNTFR